MSEHITDIEIVNFKKFAFLAVNNIGQFNLVVGDNNIGKTSFLESLLFDRNLKVWIQDLFGALSYRDLNINRADFKELNPFELFYNNQNKKYISIKFKGTDNNVISLRIETKLSSSLEMTELERLNLDNLGRDPLKFSATLYENEIKKENQFLKPEYDDIDNYLPLIGNNINYDDDLVEYYAESIQTSKSAKSKLLSNLSLIIPDIENIEISGARKKTFLITLKNKDETQIINQYGEGTAKLLRVLLESYVCRNKRLMIDEFGTGIHYSRLQKFYALNLTNCVENNVQLFATTHSKECIEYFTKAIMQMQLGAKARVIKLSQTQNGIKAYTSTFEQFTNSLEAESELR